MTEAQRLAVEEFKQARDTTRFGGPFIPLLRSPEMLSRARNVGDYVRFNSALPPRLSEFVILITARHWTQQFEWAAHAGIAERAGLDPEIIAAVADGRRPAAMAADEATVYDLCMEPVADARGERPHLCPGDRPVRGEGGHRHDRHRWVLLAARDGDEHRAHTPARG